MVKKHNVFVIRSWFFHAWPDSIAPIAGVNNKSLMDSALCESLMLLLHPSYATHTNDQPTSNKRTIFSIFLMLAFYVFKETVKKYNFYKLPSNFLCRGNICILIVAQNCAKTNRRFLWQPLQRYGNQDLTESALGFGWSFDWNYILSSCNLNSRISPAKKNWILWMSNTQFLKMDTTIWIFSLVVNVLK